jgi:hypothetical protein
MPMIPVPEGPSVNPSGAAMPAESIAGIEPNAFGASVGAAQANEGAAIGKMGDLLEKHAITLQNQKDEALNNEAVTQAINNLPSDYVKAAFDRETMRRFGYAVTNGSLHAATQFRQYETQAATSRRHIADQSAVQNLNDTQLEKEMSEENLRKEYNTQSEKELPEETIKEQIVKRQREAFTNRILSTADSSPEQAMKQLDKWKDKLDPVQAEDVRKRVVNQLSVSRSRDISIQRTTEGGGTPWHRLLQSGVETAAADPYNTTLDNGRWTGGPVKLTEMTVSEVRDLQNRMLSNPENRARYKDAAGNAVGSSAVGAPQIVGKTLQGLIDRGVVDPDAKFDENLQDKIITYLAKQRGPDVAALRQEWDGLKNVPAETIRAAYSTSFGENAPIRPGDRAGVVEGAKADAEQQAKALGLRDNEVPAFVDRVTSATEARYNKKIAEHRDSQQGYLNDLATAAMGDDPTGIKSPKTLDELLASSPDLKAKWGAADATTQIRIRNILNRNNKADYPDTIEARSRFSELWGLSKGSPKEREEFMKVDPANEELPRKLVNRIIQMQAQVKHDTEQDTKVTGLLRDVRSIIEPVIPQSNKKARMEFEGKFREQMVDWQRNNEGKQPTEEDARKVAAALVAKVPGTGWITDERLFRIEQVPASDKTSIVNAWKNVHGETPDDATVLKVYQTRMVRQRLQEKK